MEGGEIRERFFVFLVDNFIALHGAYYQKRQRSANYDTELKEIQQRERERERERGVRTIR